MTDKQTDRAIVVTTLARLYAGKHEVIVDAVFSMRG